MKFTLLYKGQTTSATVRTKEQETAENAIGARNSSKHSNRAY